MSTRFAKFEFQRAPDAASGAAKVLGRADIALYDGPFVTDDVIDDIFCAKWQLPPPKLIISVTGTAQDWDKSSASAAREPAAIMRFIRNCVYASAVDARSCWIMDGGSNGGVMRLLGDARRLLGGWGEDARLGTAAVALIGVGVASKMKYYAQVLRDVRGGGEVVPLQYNPGIFEGCGEALSRMETNAEGKQEKVNMYVPDPSHSHLLFLGSESGSWGDEVKQRVEAEEYFSAKFKAPIVYIVLGGGPVTVGLVQECIQKEAFTVVVKGSGRAADVIAEYAKNRIIHDQKHGGSPLFWELHGEKINGKKGEEDKEENSATNCRYRLQECTAKYINIVNSKYLAIFDPETTTYDDMCSRIRSISYMPSKHTFNPATLEKMRQMRHISQGIIAKNSGFEVQVFLVGPSRKSPQATAASSAVSRSLSAGSIAVNDKSTEQSAKLPMSDSHRNPLDRHFSFANPVADARDEFTDMFVSMIRRYSRHPNAPDVFATLLLSQETTEEKDSHCVKSLIEGLGAASHACLIWSFLSLNPRVSHNIMMPIQELRMGSKASLYSSVIAFSDSDLQQSGHIDGEMQDKESLEASLKQCMDQSLSDGGGNIIMSSNLSENKRMLSGIDEVFFAQNADSGERFDSQYRLKQHVALRLQAETFIADCYKSSGVYVVCGGDFKQFMSDLQWCCSQRCHLLLFADSGGLCSRLVCAVALHKCVLLVADKILQLCLKIAGGSTYTRISRICSIEHTISMCMKVLEKIAPNDLIKFPDAFSELTSIIQLLVPDEKNHNWMEGLYPGRVYEPQDRLMRRKSMTILNARRMLAPNQVHPTSSQAPSVKMRPKSYDEHIVILKGWSLLQEYATIGSNQNPYNLSANEHSEISSPRHKSRRRNINVIHQYSQEAPFLITARQALDKLSKLQWHTAVIKKFQEMEPNLSSISFEDSVLAVVNLVEKCSVSIVFNDDHPNDDSQGCENSKIVAQCLLRRAIQSPSIAMGHPAVDMFGETGLMVAVASGDKERVAQVLSFPGIDVHYICRSSAHPTAFGINALLVALMMQLPEIAEIIVDKLLELMSNPISTVFLRDDVDQQQSSDASGIGKIKHSVKTMKTIDYIQNYNPTLIHDCLSSRHPEYHVTVLMYACRWGYVQLLPKFFELVKSQESIKTSISSDADDTAMPIGTPFERYKQIMQSLQINNSSVSGVGYIGAEIAEARSQSEFKMLLLGDHNSDFGIDINGRSALHHAVSSGNSACVRFCMDLGADALRKNIKYTYRKGSSDVRSDSPETFHSLEFQDTFDNQVLIYCGFSSKELRHLHRMGEFDAYKVNLNPELSSAIHSSMYENSVDSLSKLQELIQRDKVSSVALQEKQKNAQPDVFVWKTVCNTAFDVALFSWGIHGIFFDRKKLELEFELKEQNLKKDVLVQQQALVRLKKHRILTQSCVEALEGINSQTSKHESMRTDATDISFSSRGSILVREYIRNKAYRRILAPLLSSFVLIALLFIFCSLINAGISPRETRSFAQTHVRGIRDAFMDIAGGSGSLKIRTLDDIPQFMNSIEPFLAIHEDRSVQRLGSLRMSFLFEKRKACTGSIVGMCASHYEQMQGYTSSTIQLATDISEIRDAATESFMNFSTSLGSTFRNVADCGFVYCFDAPSVQLLIPASSNFNKAWSSLKVLIPQQSALRFIQLGFVLHSPAIEQSIGVRLLFEVQEIADISVHDRFTSIRLAPDVPFWQPSSQPRGVLSILLLIFCSVRLILLFVHFAHVRNEKVAPQDGIRATYRRYIPVLFSSISKRNKNSQFDMSQLRPILDITAPMSELHVDQMVDADDNNYSQMTRLQAINRLVGVHAKLLGALASFFMSHQGISALFCLLSFSLLMVNLSIQDDIKSIFQIGDSPKNAELFASSDFISSLLDGKMQSLEFRLSSLRDLMAFALLIVFATLLKHLERLPVLGPKLCAITAVLCDSVVIVFVAFIFLVSAAYAMAAFVGYSLDTSDRNDIVQSKLETFFMRAFNQILNIDTQTDFIFTRHGYSPDNMIGSAGLYYVVTAVIGNLILSNLIVTVIGERYTLALEVNRSSHWGVELNRHLARRRVMLKLQDNCIEILKSKRPFWGRVRFWGARRMMLMWATLFEDGWKPYGLRLYPWGDEKGEVKGELQVLYESVEILRFKGDVAEVH